MALCREKGRVHFNPRPRMGSDVTSDFQSFDIFVFQSTPPHGERHGVAYHDDSQIVFQSTLPAWGATFFFACSECFFNISIHTPRMGSDHPYLHVDQVQHISIHAPRMGSDKRSSLPFLKETNFNPRSPHGERPAHQSEDDDKPHISIHAPAWGATMRNARLPRHRDISIHAPAWGATRRN